MFFTLFGYWVQGRGGGVQTRLVHIVLMQLFSPYSSKIKVSKIYDVIT